MTLPVIAGLKRILAALPTLFGITIITFFVVQAAPGDPVKLLSRKGNFGAKRIEAETRLREFMGLDRPPVERYFSWLGRVALLDFGESFDGEPVSRKLARALPPTLILGISSLVLGLLLAIPLGVLCAIRAEGVYDKIVSTILLALYSIPSWVIGMALVTIFGVWLQWLPFNNWHGPGFNELGPAGKAVDIGRHTVLILVATILPCLAHDTRFVRQAMLEELNKNYITAARGFGFPEREVIWRHAFRNTLIPLATLVGLSVPGILAGSVIMERIFNWPGMGRLFFTALQGRDYPVIMAVTTMGAVLVVAGNMAADLLCLLVDPRLRSNEIRD